MFERYTERARRVLFFARYESSVAGARSIETEHILLGLLRERKGAAARLLAPLPIDQVRREIEERTTVSGPITPTSVEIPFSIETKRALHSAANEADGLRHQHIGTEHLLLGLLREEKSLAASILVEHGLRLHEVRAKLAEPASMRGDDAKTSEAEDIVEQIWGMKLFLENMGSHFPLGDDARQLLVRILHDLDVLTDLIDRR